MPEIEGLQFNVTGESTKAQNSLQATIDKLEALSAKLAETKKSVSSLSKSLSGLGQNKGLSSFLSDLKKLMQSRSLSTFTKQLKSMQGEMNGIGQNIGAGIVQGIVSSSAQLSSVAREYIVNPVVEAVRSGFDVHSPSRVMAAIGKFLPAGLAKGIVENTREPVSAMLRVVQQVVAAAETAKAKIDKAIESGAGGEALYKGATKTLAGVQSSFAKIKQQIKEFNRSGYSDSLGSTPLQGLHDAFNNLPKAAQSAFAEIKQQIKDFDASGYKGLGDAPLQGLHDAFSKLPKVAQAAFGKVKQAATNTGSVLSRTINHAKRQSDLNAAFGVKGRDTKPQLREWTRLNALLGKVTANAGKAGAAMRRMATAPVKKLLSPLDAAQEKLKHLKYAFATVLTYGTIYRVMGLFKTGLTDGLDNLYQYSLITGNQFAASMDRAATSLLYLKNSIAAAAAPLINALAPALDFVVDKVVTLLNRFNQLVSALSGKTTYTKAVKQQTKYAEAVKDTSDAEDDAKKKADELKRSLTSFDEIHALDDNSSKDSSSSKKNDSGTEIPDYGGMFTEENIDGGISDFAKNLKDTINKGGWQSLGKMLADKVNSAIDAIGWKGAGKKFGYGLNGIIQTSYYFLKYTAFAKIGNRFAQFLDMALAQVDFSKAGGLLVRKFTSLLDLIGGFLYGLNWGLVTKSITDFWTGFFDEWSAWLDEHDWTDIGEIFQRKLQQAIDNLGMDDIASSFWRAFNKSVDAAVDFNNGFYENISQELNGIMVALSGAAVGVGAILAFSGANIPLGLAMMAWGGWEGYQAIKANWDSAMIDPVQKVVNTVLGILAPAQMAIGAILAFSGASLPLGIALMAAGAVELAATVALNWDSLTSKVKTVIGGLASFAGGALLGLGIILAATGVALPVGIALIAAGAVSLATAVALNWGAMKNGVSGVLGTILGIASKAIIPIGVILAFSGVATPLGIALIAAGAVTWAAQKKVDWDCVGDKIKKIFSTIFSFLKTTAFMAIGVMLCLSGVGIPLGLALIKKGADSWISGKDPDWDCMNRNVGKSLDNTNKTADSKMTKLMKTISGAIDKIKKFFAVTLGFKGIKLPSISVSWDTASAVGQALSKLGMPGVPNFHVNWNQYAKGGFPDEGELYIARENGSEMIGRMGNKNAVANNQQIIDGITRGVASANSQQNALLREQNELLRALLEKDTGISIGDITNAARRQNQRMGKTVIPVG